MKNPEILADMRATEDSLVIFAKSLDPNETPCNTPSHCDPGCLKFKHNGYIEHFQDSEKSGDLRKNPEKWSDCDTKKTSLCITALAQIMELSTTTRRTQA